MSIEVKNPGSLEQEGEKKEWVHPLDAREQLRRTWDQDGEFLSLLLGGSQASSFFLQTLAVPPNRFRPMSVMDGVTKEHQQNIAYGRIAKACEAIVATNAEDDGVAAARAAYAPRPPWYPVHLTAARSRCRYLRLS